MEAHTLQISSSSSSGVARILAENNVLHWSIENVVGRKKIEYGRQSTPQLMKQISYDVTVLLLEGYTWHSAMDCLIYQNKSGYDGLWMRDFCSS